jgi:RecA/RadA recombinase
MAPKKTTSQTQNNSTMSIDELLEIFTEQLGKGIENKVETFISTNSTLLDYAIANRRNGGVPATRIIEIVGNEASRKILTRLSYHF